MMKVVERLSGLPGPFERLIRQIGKFVGRGSRIERELARHEPKLAQVEQRIAAKLAETEQRIAAINPTIGDLAASTAQGFAQISERLERDVGILAEQTRQLGSQIDGLAQAFVRLDRDAGSGFGQIGQRLERDLVALANTLHEVTEATRLNTGVVSKLALDQGDLGERLRSLSHKTTAPSVEARPSWPPVLERVAQADFPEEIRAAIREDTGIGDETWCLPPSLMPTTADALPNLIDLMRAAREQLRPGDRVIMLLPPHTAALLDRDETEQALGLLGPVKSIREVETPQGFWRIAAGKRRTEAFAFALRWSIGALAELHLRSAPLFAEALERFKLADSFHGIELPGPDIDSDYWAQLVRSLLRLISDAPGAAVGIVLPPDFERRLDVLDAAVEHVRTAVQEAGNGVSLSFQWASGSLGLPQSEGIVAFARRHAIPFDFSPVNRGSHESRLAAYDDLSAYYPLAFDLRSPSFAPRRKEPIAVPRRSVRSLAVAGMLGLQAPKALAEEFDADFEQSCNRLSLVLDRRGRAEFEGLANFDPALMAGLWPDFFVYNWPPPPPGRLRLFEFNAQELIASDSPLMRLERAGRLSREDTRRLGGAAFLATAREVVQETPASTSQLNTIQVEAHLYLNDRRDVTKDGLELIAWMPQKLGVTLELGSGYGVMARRVGRRASAYVGLDLTVEQAKALEEIGAAGLVADIHVLPFGGETFDTIIADNVIEHAYDPLAALRECSRVLRPGGRAFLIIPHDYLGPRFRNQSHFWKADEASVRLAAERAGFKIVRQNTLRLAEHGVVGAFPSSAGTTGLWNLEKLKN